MMIECEGETIGWQIHDDQGPQMRSEETFAGPSGNDGVAPKPAVVEVAIGRLPSLSVYC
jgi:hypothetical protein